ncbi:leucine-rich repeat and IQ domain-containing protein 3 isoform X2 [Petromyzon marinus]|uniref:Leucine-rich repeat and IQ domain-containing protein 3 isoform X2 n=1 Tax=Petromyzon marinus TaxID=7757 RepID=A0AAJ7TD09_PETMA|nr:leucine-rich repeat and IQ domain-containing protein 3 isoform X2 [Petromyzon marinus]
MKEAVDGFLVTPTWPLILSRGQAASRKVAGGQPARSNVTRDEAARGSVVTKSQGDLGDATRGRSNLSNWIHDKTYLEATRNRGELREVTEDQIARGDVTTHQSSLGDVPRDRKALKVTHGQVTTVQPDFRDVTLGHGNVREVTGDQAGGGEEAPRGQKGGPEELGRLAVVCLSQARLGSTGDLARCHSLRFLHLGNNCIRRVEALGSCPRLLELDLHSNQISYIAKMQHFQRLLKDINAVLARHSAVHIIQRWLRGHLVRARLGKADRRLPAKCGRTSRPEREERAILAEGLARAWDGGLSGQMTSRSQCKMKEQAEVKHLTIDLNQLHTSTVQDALDRLSPTSAYPQRFYPSTWIHSAPFRHQRGHNSEVMRRKETKPLGQQTVLETRDKGDDLNTDVNLEDQQVQFRMSGLCARIHQSDPLRDLLLTRHEQACDVRKSVSQIHSLIQDESRTEFLHRPRHPTMSLDERLHRRSMGSHVLAPFETLERAQRERERVGHLTAKAETVNRAHSAKRVMQARMRGFLEEKREVAVRLREADCARMTDDLQRQKRQAPLDGDNARERRLDHDRRSRQAELDLARAFGSQQAAVGKALWRHDWQMRRQEERSARAEVAGDQREHSLQQREIVRTFLQRRQEKFQEQAATERTQLDVRLSRDAVEKTREANRRVDRLKAHRLAPRTTQIHQVHVPKESITLSLEGLF